MSVNIRAFTVYAFHMCSAYAFAYTTYIYIYGTVRYVCAVGMYVRVCLYVYGDGIGKHPSQIFW